MKKIIFFIGLFCLSCLCVFGQNKWVRDTIFTVDKQIPAFLNVSKENIQREDVGIKGKSAVLNRILNLNSESSAVLKDTLTDIAGGFHESYVEYYKGIEVEKTRCTIHYDKDGVARNVNGNFRTIEGLSVVPRIDERKALSCALSSIQATKYVWEDNSTTNRKPQGNIMIYVKDNSPYLVYKFFIETIKPKHNCFVTYISAYDGKLIDKHNAICEISTTVNTLYSGTRAIETQYYSGNYRLRDYSRGSGVETYDSSDNDYLSSNNSWNNMSSYDRAAIDAHWGAETTYDYYYNNFGRNSYDDNGAVIVSKVNYNGYNNAAWVDGSNYMMYGFAYSDNTVPLVALDIVSHELTHAVTSSTSDLFYWGESGALNEGMSDVFAVCVENEAKPNNGYKIWQMGEDAVMVRDLGNPACKYYHGVGWLNTQSAYDNGGVHTNSGVFSYWFYILATGCNGINEGGVNLPVTGIGLDKAINICYYMNAVYLTPLSDFEDAARCSYLAAQALGYGENVKNQINRAWVNVGVEEPKYYIVGDTEPCGFSEYYVENLPNNYTVNWSLNPTVNSILTNNSPVMNMCTIHNSGNTIFNTNLNATIKNSSNVVVKTESKNIFNSFDLTFGQMGNTYGGITYGSIGPASISSYSTIVVNPVCLVTLTSPLFNGMTVSHSGATLSSWSHNGNTVQLVFPYSSSVQNLLITGSNGCKMIRLTVRARPEGNIPIPQLLTMPTSDGINLTLKMGFEETAGSQLDLSTLPEWDVNIYNAASGEKVYSNHLSCKEVFINTTGWSRGTYVIYANVNGKETSCKVLVK